MSQGDKFPQHEIMGNVYETVSISRQKYHNIIFDILNIILNKNIQVTKLHNQLLCQITGENGVTSQIGKDCINNYGYQNDITPIKRCDLLHDVARGLDKNH